MTNEELMQLMTDMDLHEGGMENWVLDNAWLRVANAVEEKERERIKKQNAPEIEKTNAYIKQLELEKMESEILHNEHRKLLGEIKAMTEAARSAEREAILDLVDGYAKNNTDLIEAIRARGQE